MVMVVVMMAHWKKLIFAAAPQLLISSKVDKCCKCRKDICHTLKIFVTRFHTLKIIVTRFHTLKSTFLSQRLHQQPTLFDHTLFRHPAFSKMPTQPTDMFLRLTNRIGGTSLTRCCWSWDKISPSFVSDKGRLWPWAPLRVSIPTNSSKRDEGSTLQRLKSDCRQQHQKRWLYHPSDHWSLLLAGDHWSQNDQSERLCAVGAAGGQGEVSTNRAATTICDMKWGRGWGKLTPQPNLLLKNVACGRILGSTELEEPKDRWEPGSLDHQSKRPLPITTAFWKHLEKATIRTCHMKTIIDFL